jgi:hypothetical protein
MKVFQSGQTTALSCMSAVFSALYLLLNHVQPLSSAYAAATNTTNSSCLIVNSMTLSQLCYALQIGAKPFNNTQLIVNTTAYCATLTQTQLVGATNMSTSLFFYFSTITAIAGVQSPLLTTPLFTFVKAGYGTDTQLDYIPYGLQNTTLVTFIYCLGYQYLFSLNPLNPSLSPTGNYNSMFDNVNSTVNSATVATDSATTTTTTTAAATTTVV